MDKAIHVIKTDEAVLMPTENNIKIKTLRNCIWIVTGIMVVGLLLFGPNLIKEMSSQIKIFFILLLIGFGFYREKKEYKPSYMELQFFDEYLVMYLPKRYYSSRITRKQINTMKYSEITKCVYKTQSHRIQIYGNGESVWYNYRKDGSLPDTPTEKRHFNRGMIYFNTMFADDINFKEEIERYSPLQVFIENT